MTPFRSILSKAAFLLSFSNLGAETLPSPIDSLVACNVTWDVPSNDSFGSMPVGNGDIGINVWMEPDGDLLFYIAKVDAYDAGHLLPKLGRVRLRTDPALDVKRFRQSLLLTEAAVEVTAGDTKFRVWVDANAPVIRVQGHSATPRKATLIAETLRP